MVAFIGAFLIPMLYARATFALNNGQSKDQFDHLYRSKTWHDRMITSGCSEADLDWAKILHHRHFIHSAIMIVAAGSLMGHLFEL